MSALVWIGGAVIALGGCRLVAAFDQVQRRLDQEQGCRCPQHDAGGSCEGGSR